MERRDFMKTIGIAGGTVVAGGTLRAEEPVADTELSAMLIDTVRCVGCRSCEASCAEANGNPVPDTADETALETHREPTPTQWTVVNRYDTTTGETFVRKQCMHCSQPACAAACLTKAMYKTEEGPVIWRESKCMGCRFCMISCPFDIPKFEYHSANPKIQKCVLCWERLQKGIPPACVENCPADALLFGKRRELLDIAKQRIYEEPGTYVHHVYGEHEAGGTSMLFLSGAPFDQLGMKTDLDTTPYPELTKDFLYGVPIILTLWPAFLLALSNSTKREPFDMDYEA